MGLEQFEHLVPKIKPYTQAVTLHVMGEPLAHPQFPEFLSSLEKHNLPLILTSNGILLNRHQKTLLRSSIIKQINFSIHSFFDNFPDKDISSYLKNLSDFAQSFIETHPDAFVNYRLWNLPEAAMPTHENKQNQLIFDALKNLFANPEIPDALNIKKQKSYRLDRHIKLHFDTQFEWPSLNSTSPTQDGFCYGLQNQLAILTEGTVVPCCLDKEAVIQLGSIFHSELESILNGPRAQAILKGFQKNKAVEALCQKCQYKIRFN